MSWVPPNLAELCTAQSQVSTCQPAVIMFMSFLATYFGYSRDNSYGAAKSNLINGLLPVYNDLNNYNQYIKPRSGDYGNLLYYGDYSFERQPQVC